jgi:hypothetical protein
LRVLQSPRSLVLGRMGERHILVRCAAT